MKGRTHMWEIVQVLVEKESLVAVNHETYICKKGRTHMWEIVQVLVQKGALVPVNQ
jgi:hypothetical protein